MMPKTQFMPMNSRGKGALARAYNFANRSSGYVLSPAAFLNGPTQKTPLVTNSDTIAILDTATIPDTTIDYVIVGAGITGAYLAKRLSMLFPDKKILVLEKDQHIGGRLHSNANAEVIDPLNKIAHEFGGMRIFPSIHPRANQLLKLNGLDIVEVPYVQDNGIYYGRSKRFKNSDIFPDTESVYYVDEGEKGENVNHLITNNVSSTIIQNGYTYNFDFNNRKELYKSSLSSHDFKETVMNGENKISNENWNRFCEISGYPGLFNIPMSFVCGVSKMLSLNQYNVSTQYCIVNGYQQVPQTLLNSFTTTSFEQVVQKNMGPTRNILHNVSLSKFETNQDKTVKLLLTDENNTSYQVDTKNLYICTAASSVFTIAGFPSNFIKRAQNQLIHLPLFKLFFYYKNNWWDTLEISSGRSTTDLNINQLWFHSSNILMTYSAGNDATYWASKIPRSHQTDFINIDTTTDELVTEVLNCCSKMFPEAGQIPQPDKIAWAYWNNGTTVWSAFDLNNFDKRVKTDVQKELIYPFPDNDHICYLNNDISLNQGWVEGSIELVDDFLLEQFNLPNIMNIKSL
jgi:monoamine oxidase